MSASTDDAQPPVLAVQKLAFSYPQRHVFTGWSHEFGAGLTWVKGGNGCGKSTLLKLLAGALKPIAGEIEVQGISITAQPLQYRSQVFYCGPGPIVFDHLSPVEFFGFMCSLYPSTDKNGLARNVEGFGLHPFLGLPLSTLSTGTQRKVWLSVALSAGTKATLLDEPLNALDAKSLEYLRSVLVDCAHDTSRAYIVASHEDLGAKALIAETLEIALLGLADGTVGQST
jgi:ABC-2 type transport system ATP-binding protein